MSDIADIWNYELREGNSHHPRNGACLYNAAKWIVYGEIGDDPACACPVIRSYAIGLNDHMPDDIRQQLKPFILRVVGNRDPQAEPARLHHIVLETARRVVPMALDRAGLAAEARILRTLGDHAGYEEIRDAAAHAAAHAADAAADAAVADAAVAAHAAVAAGGAASCWPVAIDILDGALKIGRQAPEYELTQVHEAVRAFETARLVGSAA